MTLNKCASTEIYYPTSSKSEPVKLVLKFYVLEYLLKKRLNLRHIMDASHASMFFFGTTYFVVYSSSLTKGFLLGTECFLNCGIAPLQNKKKSFQRCFALAPIVLLQEVVFVFLGCKGKHGTLLEYGGKN